MNDFAVSNGLLGDAKALRKRANEDGYLYFRQLFDPDSLLNLRRQILQLCQQSDWLKPDIDLMEGIANPEAVTVEPEPAYLEVYSEVMKLQDFHGLAHYPALMAMFDTLFGEPTLVHPRNIARIIFPQNVKFTTPAHQDFVHIQGTPETWTAWTPLGDCPREQGSLAILPGSHKQDIYPTHSAYGAGGLGIETDALPFEWAGSDFRLGDTVVFHSHTIHKGMPNVTADRLRLSVDYRYQGISQPVTEASRLPHHARQSWEDIYKVWESDDYKYYWLDSDLNMSVWTPEYHQAAGLKLG